MKKILLILSVFLFTGTLLAANGDMAFYSPKNGMAPQAIVVNLQKKVVVNFTHNGKQWVRNYSRPVALVKKDQFGNWLVYIQGSTSPPLSFSSDWNIYYSSRAKWYRK